MEVHAVEEQRRTPGAERHLACVRRGVRLPDAGGAEHVHRGSRRILEQLIHQVQVLKDHDRPVRGLPQALDGVWFDPLALGIWCVQHPGIERPERRQGVRQPGSLKAPPGILHADPSIAPVDVRVRRNDRHQVHHPLGRQGQLRGGGEQRLRNRQVLDGGPIVLQVVERCPNLLEGATKPCRHTKSCARQWIR